MLPQQLYKQDEEWRSPQLHARGHAARETTAVPADKMEDIALHALKLPPPYPPLQLHICCAKGVQAVINSSGFMAHCTLVSCPFP